jgi:glycosyltransferase involved in cell wall biosynthesis
MAKRFADITRELDVMHVLTDGWLGLAAATAAKRAGVPAIVTPFAHPPLWGVDLVSQDAYRSADLLAGLHRTELAAYEELGLRSEKLRVLGAGTNDRRSIHGRELRQAYDLRGPVLLFVGHRGPHKGLPLLQAAADAAAADISDLTLVVVGPSYGRETTSGTRLVRELDLGVTTDAELDAWLTAADVLCLPSEHETFGMVVAEAWSAGTATLVSNIEPLRSLVADGGGIAVSRTVEALADGIRKIVADGTAARLGVAGRARWEREFSSQALASRALALYEEVTSGARRSGGR